MFGSVRSTAWRPAWDTPRRMRSIATATSPLNTFIYEQEACRPTELCSYISNVNFEINFTKRMRSITGAGSPFNTFI